MGPWGPRYCLVCCARVSFPALIMIRFVSQAVLSRAIRNKPSPPRSLPVHIIWQRLWTTRYEHYPRAIRVLVAKCSSVYPIVHAMVSIPLILVGLAATCWWTYEWGRFILFTVFLTPTSPDAQEQSANGAHPTEIPWHEPSMKVLRLVHARSVVNWVLFALLFGVGTGTYWTFCLLAMLWSILVPIPRALHRVGVTFRTKRWGRNLVPKAWKHRK